mgnify:CR=1 FL=1
MLAIWRDTHRLTSREAQQLLAEMFYQVAQSADEMRRLGELWVEPLGSTPSIYNFISILNNYLRGLHTRHIR